MVLLDVEGIEGELVSPERRERLRLRPRRAAALDIGGVLGRDAFERVAVFATYRRSYNSPNLLLR